MSSSHSFARNSEEKCRLVTHPQSGDLLAGMKTVIVGLFDRVHFMLWHGSIGKTRYLSNLRVYKPSGFGIIINRA